MHRNPTTRSQQEQDNRDHAEDDAATLLPRDAFGRMAQTYDARMASHPLFLVESQATLAALPDLVGKRVADVGCGTGRYTLQMARAGAEAVVGVDVAPKMLAVAERKARHGELDNITWRVGDLASGNFRQTGAEENDARFDVVVCALTLSFVADTRTAMANLSGILRPGGTLIVSDTHPHVLWSQRARTGDESAYLRFMDADGQDYRVAQHAHTFADLFDAARAAGLELNHIAEPVAERHVFYSYPALRDQLTPGAPLALVLRFVKGT